jgi:hypothetical protein
MHGEACDLPITIITCIPIAFVADFKAKFFLNYETPAQLVVGQVAASGKDLALAARRLYLTMPWSYETMHGTRSSAG